MSLRHVQQPHGVGVNAVGHRETICKIPQKPKNKNKNEDNATARGSPLRDLPEWSEEFADNLVGVEASVSSEAPGSISRGPHPQELSRKVVSGQHRIFTISRRTEIAKCRGPKIQGALCRQRIGNQVLRAEKFGDLNDTRSQRS